MKRLVCASFFLGYGLAFAASEDFSSLLADRAAVERVYYSHRLGQKPPFEEALPAQQVEAMVKLEQKKAEVLRRLYKIEVTPALVGSEIQRIEATTRAPEILADLKKALDNDPARFARSVVRPIVVDRLLRRRFENDDSLLAGQRGQIERIREELLAAKKRGASVERLLALLREKGPLTQTRWGLKGRPPRDVSHGRAPDGLEVRRHPGPNVPVASAAPGPPAGVGAYFEDLALDLQKVLGTQLRQAGDISAVIEMPTGLFLYLAKEKSEETLTVATLMIPTPSFEAWLAQQPDIPGDEPVVQTKKH